MPLVSSRSSARMVATALTVAALGFSGGASLRGADAPGSPADAGKRIEARNGVVASANALASEAGVAMLKAGGNAVDAVVATAFAVGVVEPQMSGLGGSGAATVWIAKDGKPAYLDFYAGQPADAWVGHVEPTPQGAGGAPSTEAEAAAGRREAGDLRVAAIPGAVAGLLTLHEKFGALTREQVMAPAIKLAEEGFPVGQILAEFIVQSEAKLKPFPEAMALYFPGGKALGPGDVLKNPALAESLRRVSRDGRKGFYEGPTAEGLIKVLNAGKHPARMSDLAAFTPQWKRPLCTDYRGLSVLSAPPPQTGYQVLHTLELLEPFNVKALGLPTQSPAAFDLLTSALRVGQAAARANSDPNWVQVPANGLSSALFADTRKALVGTKQAPEKIDAADAATFDSAAPAGACGRYEPYGAAPAVSTPTASGHAASLGTNPATGTITAAATADTRGAATALPDVAVTLPQAHVRDTVGERDGETQGETTHMSVVDRNGNAVALTITNSSVFGSGGFAQGFFINDSGFRFTEQNINAPSKSRWRVRTTTIAPTIVVKDGKVHLVIGAPGGGRIPTEIAQVMVYVLDYGLDPLEAVKLPRIYAQATNRKVQLEHGFAPALLRDVRAMGYDPVAESAGYARLYLIARKDGRWIGVSDPRHDGQPKGY